MKRFIIYCIGAAATAYLAILYENSLLVTFLVIELLLPVPLFFVAKRTAGKLQVRLLVPIPMADRGEDVSFELRLWNPTVLPVMNADIRITYWNQFRNQKMTKKLTVWADGRSQSCYQYQLASEHCGRLVICADRVRVRDYLGLLSFAVPGEQREIISVLPGLFDFPVEAEEELPYLSGESDDFDKGKGGDDPSEVFQVRPYRAGDRLQSIHWKMTARSEELMVKEFSLPVSCQTAVFLDLHGEAGELSCWETADDYLETVLSLEAGLLEAGRRNYAAWYDRSSGELFRKKMEKPEDVHELTGMLFQVMPYEETVDIEQMYRSRYPGENFAVIFRLDLQCRLWKGGALYWERVKTGPSG